MKFSEFQPGMTIACGSRPVSEPEVIAFAQRYDPQWFHTDPERARQGRWNGLIASGWMTCGIAMEMVVQRILADSDCFGSPGVDSLRWNNPVRPGDVLSLDVKVLETGISKSGKSGIVRWQWLLQNQHDACVLDLTATSLFDIGSNA